MPRKNSFTLKRRAESTERLKRNESPAESKSRCLKAVPDSSDSKAAAQAAEETAEQILEKRRAADSERKRKSRAAETPTEADKSRAADSERKTRSRAAETPTEADKRRAADSERKTRSRAAETPTEADKRRAADSAKKTRSRAAETPTEADKRRAADSAKKTRSRAAETPTEADKRRAADSERKTRSRAAETPTEADKRRAADSAKKTRSRAAETPTEADKRRAADSAKKTRSRAAETPTEADKRRAADSAKKTRSRAAECPEETHKRRTENSEQKKGSRSRETQQERSKRLTAERIRQRRNRSKSRAKQPKGRNAMEILNGTETVAYRNVGRLFTAAGRPSDQAKICKYCHAVKWKNEPEANCCANGKVKLEEFPDPPDVLQRLWLGQDPREKTFRNFVRYINNALALASLKVTEPTPPGKRGWKPSVSIQGKVYIFTGPLRPTEGTPVFSQLYVLDPMIADKEVELRLNSLTLRLPDGTSKTQLKDISDVVLELQEELHICNRYVREFKFAAERMTEDKSDSLRIVIDESKRPEGEHARRYNSPLNSTLKEISVAMCDEQAGDRALELTLRGESGKRNVREIPDTHRSADPFHFTLLFPTGENGWHLGLTKQGIAKEEYQAGSGQITPLQFYAYHIQLRYEENIQRGYWLHRAQRLFQEFLCVAYSKVENQRLKYIANHQKELRCEKYSRIFEDVHNPELNPDDVRSGKQVILPPSFVGSPRYMHQHFEDATAIVREFHKPDFFITFTCNPNWPEITESILPGQISQDRPDIISRVFHLKLTEFVEELTKDGVFGETAAHMSVVEFQKRGLPHSHILTILSEKDRLRNGDDVDKIICAELPNPDAVPEGPERDRVQELLDLVLLHMVHTCNADICGGDGIHPENCSKGFPKNFSDTTYWDQNAFYPTYRRRNRVQIELETPSKTWIVTDGHVVPYSPYFLLKKNCHINIEACVSDYTAKYLYKYITKGPDRAMVSVENPNDEVTFFANRRIIGASEASYRTLQFQTTSRYPAVMPLRLHLDNEQVIFFTEGEEADIADQQPKATELTAFFDYNKAHNNCQIRYVDFPKFFVWKRQEAQWARRGGERNKTNQAGSSNPDQTESGEQGCKESEEDTTQQSTKFRTIGRVNTVHPQAGDVFYLRMLLHNDHCKGKTSFEQMKVVDGEVFESYKEVCAKLGLLQHDGEWEELLKEAASTKYCPQIRMLFVTLLLFNDVSDPLRLFELHWDEWVDDFQRKYPHATQAQLKVCTLLDLERRLQERGNKLSDHQLPVVSDAEREQSSALTEQDVHQRESVIMQEEKQFDFEETVRQKQDRVTLLTPSQRNVYELVLDAVEHGKPLSVFVSARGGTGKTYLLNTLLASARTLGGEKQVALAVAASGIAATLLTLGRTFHSRFKAPLDPEENCTFSIKPTDSLAQVIALAKLIVWDESPMNNKYLLEGLDRCLRDIMQCDLLFGGKVVVLVGDFRQILPVVKYGSRAQIEQMSLTRSKLWGEMTVMELTENMRVGHDPSLQEFDKWLLDLGNGDVPVEKPEDFIRIPGCHVFGIDDNSYEGTQESMKQFIDCIFPMLGDQKKLPGWQSWISQRAILAPKNSEVDAFNALIIEDFPGDPVILYSADKTVDDNDSTRFPPEFLNTLTPTGLAPHCLILKPKIVLMLLRNINPREGLCNGTRLILDKATPYLLHCRILANVGRADQTVLIPRIDLITNEKRLPFQWKRRQFPVRPAFAMTINKSQGQTLEKAGVWLNQPVFSHGQLYVAASRVRKPSDLHIAIKESDDQLTRNVVFKDALLSSN